MVPVLWTLGLVAAALGENPLEVTQLSAEAAKPPAQIKIARGGAVFIQAELSLPAGVKAARLQARFTAPKVPSGVRFMPWVELERAERSSSLKLLYAVRASPKKIPGAATITATLELLSPGAQKPVATLTVEHNIEVVAATGRAVDVDTTKKAYLFHQGHAEAAYENLKKLHDHIRLDQLVRPPKLDRVPEALDEGLVRFYHHRARADVARSHLRALAELADRGVADAAAVAIGTLTKRPSGPALKARAIDGVTTDRGISMAIRALRDLQVDEAEGFLERMRRGGLLEKEELAKVLQLLAAVYVLRDRRPEAGTTYGRSFCLVPEQDSLLKRPLLKEAFEDSNKNNRRCKSPIAVQAITAIREKSPEGPVIIIEAPYGADPHRLGQKALVQIWGTGGGMATEKKVEPSFKQGKIRARFKDNGEYQNFAGQILLKAFLQDSAGVTIASIGDPDPVSVELKEGESMSGIDIPWWVWVVVGSAAAIGGATAAGVILAGKQSDGPTQGIGPIVVNF